MKSTERDTTKALVSNVLDVVFTDFDEDTITWAKTRVMDILGCIVSGSQATGNPGLVELVRRWGGSPEATVLMHGVKVPAMHAAMVNCIMARSLDFGPVHPEVNGRGIPGHVSETVIPTAWTAAEATKANGKDLIWSLVGGEALACRILASSGFDFDQGWDFIGTINAFGATAIAARLFKLTREQLLNALGLVLNQLAGTLQNIWDTAMSFKLLQGLAARNGIFSAELAKAGWTGCNDPFFSKYGYYELYTTGCVDPEILTKDIGKVFYRDESIKPYPGCRATHAAIDCALGILEKHPFDCTEIKTVEVLLPPGGARLFVAQPLVLGSFIQADALFSTRYAVANVLVRKQARPEHYTEEAIRNPEIQRLAESLVLRESSTIGPMGGGIVVRLNDGTDLVKTTSIPKGDRFHNPITVQEIESKFRANLSGAVSEENQEVLLEQIDRLDEVPDVSSLISLLD
jgi:2-methylcitrate dehydratase PrpD